MANRRTWIQLVYFAITNGNFLGFITGRVYNGPLKATCVPGLNCYSCPGAFGACPIGAMQSVLNAVKYDFSFYVLGFLMAFGASFGRLICGFLCPFGFVQDLLYKIPFFGKRKRLPGEKWLRKLPYVILILFVFLLPMLAINAYAIGIPWFCKYICPSGTLFGGIPLLLANDNLQGGLLLVWKLTILIVILILSLVLSRPFCRYLCPLGAIYGLCNPISLYRYHVNESACTACKKCKTACPMDIPAYQKPNSTDCIRCGACKHACPHQAITSGWGKKTVSNRTTAPSKYPR